jgi:hypothetical protein
VPRSWLRTYAEALRLYHIHPETKFLGASHAESGRLRRRHVFATIPEYIGKEADRWEEDSHFGADEDLAIAYGVSPEDRARLIDAIRHAVRVEKLGVKRLAKRAQLADRAVSRAVAGDSELTDDEIVGLSRSAEDLLARKRAEDGQVNSVLDWARAQPRSWLAAELGYDQSNLSKVIAGRITPKRVIERIRGLQHRGTKSRKNC